MDDRIRVSDADRERVTARLREHFAEGRLTSEELDERITAALNAKTFGELRIVLADLPEPGTAAPQSWEAQPWQAQSWQGRAPRPRRTGYPYRHRPRLLPLVLILLIFALVLPGAGLALFTLFKVVLLVWLAFCLVGIIAAALAAARFRRHVRRYWRSGDGSQWHHYQWRNW
ncbi:MAG TPA: DUF1707 domain-containing protein [Streptosporangiaceae bacterium]|nr:DUF1707 domain-containing protein [Streptosporangiaceae bacterium]